MFLFFIIVGGRMNNIHVYIKPNFHFYRQWKLRSRAWPKLIITHGDMSTRVWSFLTISARPYSHIILYFKIIIRVVKKISNRHSMQKEKKKDII